jgi:CheY-like chemotaxis protein
LVDVAGDGRAAVAAAGAAAAASAPYDLVLVDLHMPRMDGLAAAEVLLAATPAGAAPPVVVAVTADASAGLPERCRAAGMSAFISKPFRVEDMRRVVQLVRARASQAEPQT